MAEYPYKKEMEWVQTAPIGILLKRFWKELDFKSKREFLFSLCELVGHIPGHGPKDSPKVDSSSEILGVYKFLWDLLDFTDSTSWRYRLYKPKFKTYFEYLAEIEAKKNYRWMAMRK